MHSLALPNLWKIKKGLFANIPILNGTQAEIREYQVSDTRWMERQNWGNEMFLASIYLSYYTHFDARFSDSQITMTSFCSVFGRQVDRGQFRLLLSLITSITFEASKSY